MKAMKTKMLIFVFLLGITDLFAQTLYVPGAIVKGKNASYYCSFENKLLVKVNNINNVDTTTTMYYDDGTVVPHYVGLLSGRYAGWFRKFYAVPFPFH